MRTKPGPAAKLLPSAHAVEREFRVMRALAGTDVPVPRMHVLCEDEARHRPRLLRHGVHRRAACCGTSRCPAFDAGRARRDLRRDEPRDRGAAHGRRRRPSAWPTTASRATTSSARSAAGRKQYQASITEPIEAMDRLIEWLPAHIPASARDETQVSIVHGDYRLDNLMFHPTEPRIIAVLDWELSTLGHPLADFSYHCMAWHIPHGVVPRHRRARPRRARHPERGRIRAPLLRAHRPRRRRRG